MRTLLKKRRSLGIVAVLMVVSALGFAAAENVAASGLTSRVASRVACDSTDASLNQTTAPTTGSTSTDTTTTPSDSTTTTDTAPTDTTPTDTTPTNTTPTDTTPTDTTPTTTEQTTTETPPPDPPPTDTGGSTDPGPTQTLMALKATPIDPCAGTGTSGGAAGSNSGGLNQNSGQANVGGSATGTVQTQPCQTPRNPGVTCGNNAATQVALVTQNCNATSNGGGPLKVDIKDENGTPVSSQLVGASVCLNYSQVYQIVQQLCVECQLVVQNFYSTTNNNTTNTTNQTVATGWTGPIYLGYCMPKDHPVMRGDGTVGWLVVLLKGQPDTDPVYKGATLAPYDPKLGYTCPGTASAPVPAAFTFTVPAALVGQYMNLCIQPSDPKAKPNCHSVKIDGTATVTLPVAANMAVSVTKNPASVMKPLKRLTKKQLAALASRYNKLTKKPAKTTVKLKAKTKAKKVITTTKKVKS
jgi:hypothetical protein